MTTRGLIGIKQKNGSVRYIYNHNDSYPSCLMKNINEALIKEKNYEKLKKEIENGKWNNSDITNITEIDYLWHEFVYILNFDKKTWSAYETNHDKKKLIPIMENIKFKDKLTFLFKDNDEYVIKIKKIIKNEPNYQILYDEKLYYLITKDEVIETSKSKTKILAKAISEKL